jgi:hypothetical protein
MAANENLRYGEFSTKKDREEYGKELRVAHFSIGNEKVQSTTTYNSDFAVAEENKSKDETKGKVDAKTLSKSNFLLGLDNQPRGTSYNSDFAFKNAEKVTLNKDVLKDLRATHYTLGNDERDFTSIQKRDYKAVERKQKSDFNIDTMKKKMRTQNFKFGEDPVLYQSSSSAIFKSPSSQAKNNKPL